MKQLVTALALVCGLVTAVVMVGGGAMLLAIQDSGERGSGALIALCGLLAFAFILILALAPSRLFFGRRRNAVAIAAGLLAAVPTAGLAFATLRFVKLPFGSPVPAIDWPLFAAGIVLVAGAVAIVALGYRRSQDAKPVVAMPSAEGEPSVADEEGGDRVPIVHMQQIRDAQRQLRSAFESELAPVRADGEDEVRVRRV